MNRTFVEMGIKNLLSFVKPMTVKVHIREFAGQTCAVDISCWLHKALPVSYKKFGDDRRFVMHFIISIQMQILRKIYNWGFFCCNDMYVTFSGWWKYVMHILMF